VEQARSLAGDMLEASPDDLRLSGGVFAVAGSPDQELALMDIAVEAELRGISLTSTDWETPSYPTYPYGAHVAVVEVDVETGNVSLQRYVAVDDCGRILNEMIVKGQMHGSIAQGIGQALFEELVYDELGQPLTTSLAGYDLPRAADVPSILTASFVTPTPTNPLGVKGVGEAGCLGAPPAIVNAVIDALAPLGVTHVNVPLRPSVVWQAIREAERN